MKNLSLLLSISLFLLFGGVLASAQTTNSSTMRSSAIARNWDSFKPETLTGKISLIDANQHLVAITTNGVTYDMTVNRHTKIKVSGSHATFKTLAGQIRNTASVTFIARPKGDYAQSITVSS